MKATLVFILCCLGAAFAFGTGGAEDPEVSGEVELNPLGELPIVNEVVTYTIFSQQPAYITDLATNEFTKWYEEQTNVRLEWQVAAPDALDEARSLLLASGDYPDIFMWANVTPEEEVLYGSQGVFVALNDLIDDHAPELKGIFASRSYLEGAITTPDGNIYSLPHINECYHCAHSMRAWINEEWLETLGLDMPTTTDEFYDVLVAFRDRDPNGNGEADEIPLVGATTGWNPRVYDFFINSFIYNPGPDRNPIGERLFLENGEVVATYAEPEFRDALRYLHRLYEEDLIAPESFTQDNRQLAQLATNPDVPIIGAGTFGVWWGITGQDNTVNADGTIRGRTYRALAPLEGPKGVRYTTYYPFAHIPMMQITSEAENPEILMRWADKLYTLEYTMIANAGPRLEGVQWRWAEEGEIGINGQPAVYTFLEAAVYPTNESWVNMATTFRSNEFRLGQMAPPNDPWDREVRLYNLSRDVYNPYVPEMEMIYPPVYIDPADVGELARLKTAVKDYVEESIVRFITGDLDIEADWNDYMDELDVIDIDRYLEIYQEAYDRQYN